MQDATATMLLRMTRAQRDRIRADARARGISANAYVILKTLGDTPAENAVENPYDHLLREVHVLRKTLESQGFGDALAETEAFVRDGDW